MSATYDAVATGTSITLSKRTPSPAGRAERETFTFPLSEWAHLEPALAIALTKAREEQSRIERSHVQALTRRRDTLREELAGVEDELAALSGQS